MLICVSSAVGRLIYEVRHFEREISFFYMRKKLFCILKKHYPAPAIFLVSKSIESVYWTENIATPELTKL